MVYELEALKWHLSVRALPHVARARSPINSINKNNSSSLSERLHKIVRLLEAHRTAFNCLANGQRPRVLNFGFLKIGNCLG